MQFLKKNHDYLALLPILAVAAFFRWKGFAEWSLTNDELSALYGLSLETLSLTINDYVYNDMHPAGVQLLMFAWCKIFGTSVFAVRLPFVVMGILSVALTFEVGKRFFSANVGLMAAAYFAIMQLPVLYTQLARPYSSGMLLVLWTTIAWHNLVSANSRASMVHYLHWSLTTALCLYNHYFSALVPIVLGFSGYFILDKSQFKAYSLSGMLSLLLFLPHLSLSIAQFSRGGVGTWLGPPDIRFFNDFFFALFNENYFTWFLFSMLAFFALVKSRANFVNKPNWIISLVLFLFPLLLGYFYSVYVNPVLQPSILLFFVPFLLMAAMAGFTAYSARVVVLLSFLVLGIGSFTIIKVNKFNQSEKFATFSEIARLVQHSVDSLGRDNIDFAMNVVHPFYLEYYFKRKNITIPFLTSSNKGGEELRKFRSLVNQSNKKYFLYTWTNSDNPLQIYSIIREKFPCLIERKFFFNSEFYLFAKQDACTDSIEKTRFVSVNTFKTNLAYWSYAGPYKDSLNNQWSGMGQLLTPKVLYSENFEAPLKDLILQTDDIILASVDFKSLSDNCKATLCISVSDSDKDIHWSATPLSVFIDSTKDFSRAYHAIRIPEIRTQSAKVKVYVANPDATGNLIVNNFVVKATDGNPLLYGKRIKFSSLPE
jgi:hypothetical protein